jgi:protease I
MRVLLPLPDTDFDPTESGVPYKLLVGAGHDVAFATPTGATAAADERMLSGRGLGPWRKLLMAGADAIEAYQEMTESAAFRSPLSYEDVPGAGFDAIVLPGGHAPGMKPFLESALLARAIAAHFSSGGILAAICHGVLLAARSVDDATGCSILEGKRATALPATMELSAWAMTALWLGRYYRTYDETVEAEVTRALGATGRFDAGPFSTRRDSLERTALGFVVRDGNLLTGRWPGDAHRFAGEIVAMLREREQTTSVLTASVG